MFFNINGGELIVLLVVIALVVGPERLPAYAEQLAHLVRRARVLLRDTRERVTSELGEAGEGLDWEALDPRRYDPRRIVREALAEDVAPAPAVGASSGSSSGAASGAAVFDDEAT